MGSISDQMFTVSLMPLITQLHGETIMVLTGQDAGKFFTGVREVEQDILMNEGDNTDPRGKVVLRFDTSFPCPRLSKTDRIKTDDGLVWTAIIRDETPYLTVDYELANVVAGKDT